MILSRVRKFRVKHVCNASLDASESSVQSGLAYTPSEMAQMASEGNPVSLSSTPVIDVPTVPKGDYTVPLYKLRGIGLNELYELQHSTREKFQEVHASKYD